MGGAYAVAVGAGVLGRLRVAPLRPRSNDDFTEYYVHAADVTQVTLLLLGCGGASSARARRVAGRAAACESPSPLC